MTKVDSFLCGVTASLVSSSAQMKSPPIFSVGFLFYLPAYPFQGLFRTFLPPDRYKYHLFNLHGGVPSIVFPPFVQIVLLYDSNLAL